MRFRINVPLLAVALLLARPLSAQIPPANTSGVAAGHEHFRAADFAAAERFWVSLGGVPTPLEQQRIFRFPGVYIMVARATAETPVTGGTEGSTVDSIVFRVKSLKSTLDTVEKAGYKPLPHSTARTAYLMAPHNAKVQLVEDPSLSTTVATGALVMKVPNVAEAAAWYAKWFGANVVQRSGATYADIPGMNIRFEAAKEPAATRGRALDHIGFEVKNLEAFVKKLVDGGVTVNIPFRPVPDGARPLRTLAFITDPWGTYIELNDGFADLK